MKWLFNYLTHSWAQLKTFKIRESVFFPEKWLKLFLGPTLIFNVVETSEKSVDDDEDEDDDDDDDGG